MLYAVNRGNEGSKRIVLKCGGTYESDVYDSVDEVYVERYWFDLSVSGGRNRPMANIARR